MTERRPRDTPPPFCYGDLKNFGGHLFVPAGNTTVVVKRRQCPMPTCLLKTTHLCFLPSISLILLHTPG